MSMPPRPLPLATGRCAFGDDPRNYARARPGYPPALYASLDSVCGPLEDSRIFELGPGPGTATLALLEARPASLVAIEPDTRLAARLREAAGGRFPQLAILPATFEEAALPAGVFDLGVAATAFHWLEQAPALAKAAKLLRPGGWWAMWWNVFGDPDAPDPFQRASGPLFRALPASRSWPGDGRRPFALDREARLAELRTAGFTDVRFESMRWTIHMDSAQVRALAATFSQVSLAPPLERERFLAALGELVEREFGGRVERRFSTALYLGRKRGQARGRQTCSR